MHFTKMRKKHHFDHSYLQNDENPQQTKTPTELIHHENKSSCPYSHLKSQIILRDTFEIYSREEQQFYKCSLKLSRTCLILSLTRRHFVDYRRKVSNNKSSRIKDKILPEIIDEICYSNSSCEAIEDSICISLDHVTNAYRREKLFTDHSHQHKNDMIKSLHNAATNSSSLIDYETLITKLDDQPKNDECKSEQSLQTTSSYLYISVYDTSKSNHLARSKCMKNKRVEESIFKNNNAAEVYIFAIDKIRFPELNISLADKWVTIILALIQCQGSEEQVSIDHPILRIQNGRRLLIMMNLCSGGQDKSLEIFKCSVLPILLDSQIEFDILNVNTQFKSIHKQVKEFFNKDSIKPIRWRGIIMISDDALFHHVVNSLMNRKDWPLAISVPLGIIPGGRAKLSTANGLVHSIKNLDKSQASCIKMTQLVEISTKNILKGITNGLDLLKITTNTNVVWSHLSLNWAFPPKNRCIHNDRSKSLMANSKSIFWSLRTGAAMTSYRGRLYYKVAQNEARLQTEKEIKNNSTWTVVEGNFLGVVASNVSHSSQAMCMAPRSRPDDNAISLVYAMNEDLSFLQRYKFCQATETGDFTLMPQIKELLVSQLKLEPLDKQENVFVDGKKMDWKGGLIQVEIIPGIARLHYSKR